MDRVNAVRPGPRRTEFAGSVYPVWEARLGDLMRLQDYVDSLQSDPLAAVAEALAAETTPEGRDRVVFDAHYDLSNGGVGPACDSPEGESVLLGTAGGLNEFLTVALSRGTPGLDAAGLVDALAAGGAEAVAWLVAVRAAFYGSDPVKALEGMMGHHGEARGDTLTWAECVAELSEAYGWPPETVYGLTLTEFVTFRRRGRPKRYGWPPTREWIDRADRAYGRMSAAADTATGPA